MRLNAQELVALGSLFKAAQAAPQLEVLEGDKGKEDKPKRKAPPRPKKRLTATAYPDYAKSLVAQGRKDPTLAGVTRGVAAGGLGAVMGAVITRIISNKASHVGLGAAAGGLAGAIPGYISGKNEALSDYSRLLFLRRLGVSRPGELEAILRVPETTDKVTTEGVQI